MKKLLFLVAMMLPVLASASLVYPLYDFDYARSQIGGAFIISGGPVVNLDNAMYDKDGKKIDTYTYVDPSTGATSTSDFAYKSMDIWVPIRLGFTFDEQYSAGIVVPVAMLSQTTSIGGVDTTQANTGMGNSWLWGKAVYSAGGGFLIAPRLGVRLPVGAYTIENQQKDMISDPTADVKAITGNKSLAVDISALFASRPESNPFRLDGSIGLRYSFEGTYTYDQDILGTTYNYEVRDTPGMTLDLRAMPGMAFGESKKFEAYLMLDYSLMLTESKTNYTVDGVIAGDTKSTGGTMFSAGIKTDYAFDPNNAVELKFLYDVMATGLTQTTAGVTTSGSIPAGMSVGLGYMGYIKL